jgi:hypothetical protein
MVEFITFVDGAHFLLLVLHNLKNVSHNVRKESYTQHHYNNRCDHFNATNGVIVTITNGRKRRKSEITSINQLLRFIMQTIFQNPSMLIFDIFYCVKVFRDEIPNAPKEISDDKSYNNHSYQFI